jgi:hypothetical protein
LYTQVIPLPLKALVRAVSLYKRPRLSPVNGPVIVGFKTAAEEAVLKALPKADVLGDIRNIVGTVIAPKQPAA